MPFVFKAMRPDYWVNRHDYVGGTLMLAMVVYLYMPVTKGISQELPRSSWTEFGGTLQRVYVPRLEEREHDLRKLIIAS